MEHNEIIYQIFPRNYSKEGTFKEIEKDLKRIKDLGTTIIYLMPIHEIGVKARKGTYGSPYAIKDYFSISKDLGNKDDLINLINAVHKKDMKIILDMVFNHTAPDNILLPTHEDYYFHKNGELGNRVGDWSDIVDLATDKKEVQDYLISVLKYWVSLGIDGFRFDVASMINFSLFSRAREELGKDIIFIGESVDWNFSKYLHSINDIVTDDYDMYPVFDSLYNYNWFREFEAYIANKGELDTIIERINLDGAKYMRMLCLENHDLERIASFFSKDTLGKWLDFFGFISGQAFIYAGQEYGNKHKPELFEKDPVDFSYVDKDIYNLYKKYINTKKNQKRIIEQRLEKVDDSTVKVNVTYIDKTKEERAFSLPRK